MPYTTFYARKSYIEKNEDTCIKFSKAISKGLKYVNEHKASDTAKVISKQFPDNSINDLILMINNYKKADSWLENSNVTKKSFENLEDLLIKNKLIKDYAPYKKLVINYAK